jgi:hypothetical protein
MDDIKQQIETIVGRLDGNKKYQQLADQGKQLVKKITAWDGELIQRKSQSYDDVINFPNKLSAEYLFVRGQMATNIPVVTKAVVARVKELDGQWAPLKAAAKKMLDEEIADFNRALKAADLGLIFMGDE